MRWIIRVDLAASMIAHLTLLALVIVVSEVHPFQPRAETVSVEIVTPNELRGELKDKPPEFAPPQMPVPNPSERSKAEASNTSSPPSPASPTPHEEAPQSPPSRGEVNSQSTTQSAPPTPAFKPVEPDISVKYGVMLGWPGGLPLFAEDKSNVSDGGSAKETVAAGLPASVIAEFRRHLRTCMKLPPSIAPSDNVHIKLRVVLTPDGRLAGPPVPIEGSPSFKGPIMVESAKRALAACQPYRMLPADQYREWKVLEIPFTPHDFSAS